ncbi:hypothetical protein D3C71_1460890 [compost metagenome]
MDPLKMMMSSASLRIPRVSRRWAAIARRSPSSPCGGAVRPRAPPARPDACDSALRHSAYGNTSIGIPALRKLMKGAGSGSSVAGMPPGSRRAQADSGRSGTGASAAAPARESLSDTKVPLPVSPRT